ncbi:tetratricopeptide repeat protein [Pseudodesulfovibrio tunisiensis]|uniref:tetratricopeptide repeat protein n=1 Tax=Pseudodesulfovibrio tunisiensis TaxID=463192 RepID=UPI001FB1F8AA|nr:tetratricopeptide repeat protein [Pseudodesulfovibrio tunisiensis]
MPDKKYDAIVYDFFEKEGGTLVLVTQDLLFRKMLQSTIQKTLSIKSDSLSAFENVQPALKRIKDCTSKNIPIIMVIERLLSDRPTTDTIITLKKLLPETKVIVLVGETRRENIAYFYEIGVNNVISKPASVNNIIEKLAFTIKPQGKLSELMHKGKQLLAEGKLKEVLGIAQSILKIKPNSPAGLMLQGDVFLEAGHSDKAIASYLKAHESSRLYLEPLKKLANVYKDIDEDKYLEYMKRLDRLSPLNTERKTDIGAVHLKRNDVGTAEKYFDQAIETATREAMSMVGSVAERISETVSRVSPRMSEKYLAQVIESKGANLTKDDLVLFNKLGIALRGQGKWREAIENYTRALKISPNDEGLHYNMGMAYYDGGEKRMALKCFEEALKHNPALHKDSEVASVNIGALYVELRHYEDALPFFENALRLNPNNATAKRRLDTIRKALA